MHPLLAAAAALALAQGADRDLKFLKDQTETRSFRLGQPTAIRVTPDGARVLFLRSLPRKPENQLYSFEVASGRVAELITPQALLGSGEEQLSAEEKARRERMRITSSGFTAYDLSEDGAQVLVTLSGRAWVLPTAGGGKPREVGADAQGRGLFDPRFSPDGKSVSFIRDGELWVAPIDPAAGSAGSEGKPAAARQLTHGATALKTHGQAEFVAQEEFNRFTGYWWSPDSTQLCFEEADSTGVESMDFTDPARPERPAGTSPYPRPGKANAKTRFAVVGANGGEPVFLALEPRWEYVAEVRWTKGSPLTLEVLTRDQKDEALLVADPATGKTRALLQEHDDAWVNSGRELRWLRDGSGFLWSTEQRGAWQLELRKPDGTLVRALTPPDWGFAAVISVDAAHQSVLVRRSVEPVDSQLWSVPLSGDKPSALTGSRDPQLAVAARDAGVLAVTTATAGGKVLVEVIREGGRVAGVLPSVAEEAPFTVRLEVKKTSGPPGFWTAVIRPHDYDPKKHYPILLQVYGGPHVNTVRRTPGDYVADQWIADHGFIVVHADGRGTPGRGRAWERAILGKFAEVPLDDQIAALQALAAEDPSLDLSRVGTMGHSFGGFLAALSVMRRPDFFRAAVASAPVVDWKNYDTGYTERYLGVPAPAGKSDAYAGNGLVAHAKDLQRPLLLLHGTADDNVHFSESLLLYDTLFRAGRSAQVEFIPMISQTHQFRDPTLNLRQWQRVFGFFEEKLTPAQKDRPPPN